MNIKNVLAGVAVAELEPAIKWYATLLGREPDTRPMDTLAEWVFEDGGWLQLFADSKRAGSSSVTLAVSDINARLQALAALDVPVVSQKMSDDIKIVIVNDPDKNQIVFAEGSDFTHRSTAS